MSPRLLKLATAALVSTALTGAQLGTAAQAGGFSHPAGSFGGKTFCAGGGNVSINKSITIFKPTSVTNNVNIYKPTTINKNISIYKPTTINKNINVYKPTTINKNINIYKPVTINKNINISKNIDASKNISINKSIVINKGSGGGSAEASAFASASASASAQASASANVVIYNGFNEYVTVNNHVGGGGDIGAIHTTGRCQMQEASVVKAIHAVCVAPDGREFPASHMVGNTWIDSSMEGEILRCIPGSHLKVVIGDVIQSNQGMAGLYSSGQTIQCTEDEALSHFKDGMVKCTPKVPVKDCTERTNLRRWGTGDMFFTYRSTVCVAPRMAAASRDLDVTGMSLEGGVGGDE